MKASWPVKPDELHGKFGGSQAGGGASQPLHPQQGRLARISIYNWSMSQETADPLKKALNLSVAERANLAGSLIESLDETSEESVQAAWNVEIARRMEDLKLGKVKAVSLDEARRRPFSAIEMTARDFMLHPVAVEEAEAAARWSRERSPRAACRSVDELNLVIDKIVEAPIV
jgi:putative addiction module component (TIGR02574 family)